MYFASAETSIWGSNNLVVTSRSISEVAIYVSPLENGNILSEESYAVCDANHPTLLVRPTDLPGSITPKLWIRIENSNFYYIFQPSACIG